MSDRPSLLLQVSVAAIWTVLNVTFNFFNKWVLSPTGAGFGFPAFYTACHMVSSVVGALVIMRLRPELNTLSREQLRVYKFQLLLLSMLFATTLLTNNTSLQFLSLSVNNVIKSMAPLPQAVLSYVLEGKTTDPTSAAVIVMLCIFGGLSIPVGTPSYSLLGLLLAIASLLAVTVKVSTSAVLMKDAKTNGLNPTVLVFYDCFNSIFICMSLWFFNPHEYNGTRRYFAEHFTTGVMVCMVGSLLAVSYNLTSFTLTKTTSSMTAALLACGSKVGVIAFSAGFIERTYPLGNWLALLGFFACVCYYVYLNLPRRRPGPRAADANAAAEAGIKPVSTSVGGVALPAPTERTPLTACVPELMPPSKMSGCG